MTTQSGTAEDLTTRQERLLSSGAQPVEPPSTTQSPLDNTQTGASSPELVVEALQTEERGRLRVAAMVLIAMACFGLGLAPILGGDPTAKKVFSAGLVGAVLTMAWLLRHSYVSSYKAHVIGLGGVSLAVANTCTLYYIGTFSQAATTGALGLYIFCLGQKTRWTVMVYATLAGAHGLLVALIVCGVTPDRGLVGASTLPMADQIALHFCLQAVYAIAFFAGTTSRRKLEQVFDNLENATRQIAQRDALLNEAKRDLERVVQAGGEGRFTDQIIGSFHLGNVIGRGGMGDVYAATHVETREEAAVKLLQRVFSDADGLARFAREAKAAAALDSPHVVRVLEVPDAHSPLPYLAMERLRGEDLAALLRRERHLSPRELAALARQVGLALDAARAAGVVHRDIKPQNLFLARQDQEACVWKVLDFGVSKLADQATLTRDQLIGTPEYMAPEQAAGGPVDHRADLYGLAAVLYRCVTSRPPFVEDSLAAVVHSVTHQMPVWPSHLASVSSDVESFLAIGLAKDAQDRFTSGEQLSHAFDLALAEQLPVDLRARAEDILKRMPWSKPNRPASLRP